MVTERFCQCDHMFQISDNSYVAVFFVWIFLVYFYRFPIKYDGRSSDSHKSTFVNTISEN